MTEDRKHTFSSVFYLIYYTFSSDLFPLDCADPNKSPRQHYGQYHDHKKTALHLYVSIINLSWRTSILQAPSSGLRRLFL